MDKLYLLASTFEKHKKPISIYMSFHKFFLLYSDFPCMYFYPTPFQNATQY